MTTATRQVPIAPAPRITGATTINHALRIKLRLTLDEYAIIEMFYRFQTSNKKIDADSIWKELGMTVYDCVKAWEGAKLKGAISKSGPRYLFCDAWLRHFNAYEDFEELWKVWLAAANKPGNKRMAQRCYTKSRALIEKDQLHASADKYLKSVKDKDFVMHLSTWLNPRNRHWENVIKEPPQENPKVYAGSFFD